MKFTCFPCRVGASKPSDFGHPLMEKVLEFLLDSSRLNILGSHSKVSRSQYLLPYGVQYHPSLFLVKEFHVIPVFTARDYYVENFGVLTYL